MHSAVVNLSRGDAVCERVVHADTPLRRMIGLMGRRAFDPGNGLVLRPVSAIHTGFMRFPIDVVFLDDERNVVKIVERLRPWRVAFGRHAQSVLELPAGEAAQRGIQIGDRLGFVYG